MAQKHSHAARKKGGAWKILLVLVVLLVLAAGAALLFARSEINGRTTDAEPVTVSIQQGSGVSTIAQKLKDAGLDLVTRQPETAVTILADGRRLWRVFDNLMNNICKYAQRGTRVYLTLEERDGQAVISFKNTSRAPLDIPAEELLERFVRGDAARGGEGNGLGLSIARSLTELQKGTLELTVDGDLFKVVLRFSELS